MKNWTGHHFNELNYIISPNILLLPDLQCLVESTKKGLVVWFETNGGGDYISSWLQVTVRTVF